MTMTMTADELVDQIESDYRKLQRTRPRLRRDHLTLYLGYEHYYLMMESEWGRDISITDKFQAIKVVRVTEETHVHLALNRGRET